MKGHAKILTDGSKAETCSSGGIKVKPIPVPSTGVYSVQNVRTHKTWHSVAIILSGG